MPAKPPAPSEPFRFGAGTRPQVTTGLGPDPVFSLPLWIEALRGPWSARAAFERVSIHGVPAGRGTAHWTWTVGRGEACVRALRAGSVTPWACGFFEAGSVRAGAEGIAIPRDASRLWIGVGPVVRVDWEPVRGLVFDVAVGLRVPLTRDRFYIEPDLEVHRPPWAAPFAGIGLGGRIP